MFEILKSQWLEIGHFVSCLITGCSWLWRWLSGTSPALKDQSMEAVVRTSARCGTSELMDEIGIAEQVFPYSVAEVDELYEFYLQFNADSLRMMRGVAEDALVDYLEQHYAPELNRLEFEQILRGQSFQVRTRYVERLRSGCQQAVDRRLSSSLALIQSQLKRRRAA